jgi:predicted Rossmann fold flavoprotein
LGPAELIELLEAEGLKTKVEACGKIFPRSDRAADVLSALRRRLERSGAEIMLGDAVTGVRRANDRFCLATGGRDLLCEKLVITTGGKSYPGSGTTGDGYRWAAAMGHTIRAPRPALVPLRSEESWVRELSGVTIPDVRLQVKGSTEIPAKANARRGGLSRGVLIERRGSLLFTHFGLSGPVVLDVSRAVTGAPDLRRVRLVANFVPAINPIELENELRGLASRDGKRSVAAAMAEHVPRRLAVALFELAGVPGDRRAAEFSSDERGRLVRQFKECEIRITGSRGFEKAEVTAGGIALSEIDSRTMESKLVPDLFFAGEILDLDGFIGGYNFQAAFSTGWLAGSSV